MFVKLFILFLQRLLTLKTVAVEQKNYQEYIGCFISKFSQILNAGFGMKVQIIPCSDKPNTFVRVDIVQSREIGAQVKEEEPFKKVFVDCGLDKYIQGAESINFGGTNTFWTDYGFCFLKENSLSQFSVNGAIENFRTIVEHLYNKRHEQD